MKRIFSYTKLISAILVITMASGCVKPPDKKTLGQIQKENIDAGMRGISPQWKLVQSNHDERGSFYGWAYGSTHRWAASLAKSVHINTNGNIVYSEDYYYSGRVFNDFDADNIDEKVTVHFNYDTKTCAIGLISPDSALKARIPDSIQFPGGNPAEALKIADEILSGWKTSRKE